MRRATGSMTLAAALLLLASCAPSGGGAGGSASPDDAAEAIAVEVAETEEGASLVGTDGRTLYMFTEDSDGTSTCYEDCAAAWPPFEVEDGATVEAGEGVTGELDIIERDDGASQVTYEGMPLYYYAADAEPGDATGHGVGGVWFIASPEGQSGAEPTDDGGAAPTPTYSDGEYDY